MNTTVMVYVRYKFYSGKSLEMAYSVDFSVIMLGQAAVVDNIAITDSSLTWLFS